MSRWNNPHTFSPRYINNFQELRSIDPSRRLAYFSIVADYTVLTIPLYRKLWLEWPLGRVLQSEKSWIRLCILVQLFVIQMCYMQWKWIMAIYESQLDNSGVQENFKPFECHLKGIYMTSGCVIHRSNTFLWENLHDIIFYQSKIYFSVDTCTLTEIMLGEFMSQPACFRGKDIER